MAKKITIGNLLLNEIDGRKMVSIGLGQKNKKNPKYDLTVEITVKDATGKVVASQKDGWINLVNPRTQPDELLAAGIIKEDAAIKMKEDWKKLETANPAFAKKLQYKLTVDRND